MSKHNYLKIVLVFQDGWADAPNMCSTHLYTSPDRIEWKHLETFYTVAAESTHLHILAHVSVRRLRRYLKINEMEPGTVVLEIANLGPYLEFSRTIPYVSKSRRKLIDVATKAFRNVGKTENALEVQLGDLTKKSYPVVKPYLRRVVEVPHFENSGIPDDLFCVEESKLRKKLGMWNYGN